ncbi:MAG: FecR family protein [Verrucomicrobia bacterium]|nr:FecR family protein [Prolixibacteraceae bacterium]
MRSNIEKHLSGDSSEPEQKVLLDWIRQDKHLAEFQEVKKEWKDQVIQEPIPSKHQESWNNIQNNLLDRMQLNLQRTERRLSFFRYAAILVVLISIPSILYFYSQSNTTRSLIYTTVSADFGQISKVLLPDSTVIWINSGSTIRYNNLFATSNRDIDLTGEAFFKVHKNKDLPLVVSSEDLRVKVLGTEFSVVSYPKENEIQVILEEGKVELTSVTHSSFAHEMKPGELAIFNKLRKDLTISNVNTDLYTSWKDGIINIYNLPLSEVIVKLERRYNQKFVVDSSIKDLPYTFTIKNENLNSILSLMEKITPVDVVQHDNVIELKRNNTRKR